VNVFDYATKLTREKEAELTTFLLTDQRVQSVADLVRTFKETFPSELTVPVSFAWQAFKALHPEQHLLSLPEMDTHDRATDQLTDSVEDRLWETADSFLAISSQDFAPDPLEGPVPAEVLERQQEAAATEAREHARRQDALEDQLKEARASFELEHDSDPLDQQLRDQQLLDEAERTVRGEEGARQSAEREAREVADSVERAGYEREEQEIEAKDEADRHARDEEAERRVRDEEQARQTREAEEDRER
jgi:hypothetical protein